VPNRIFNVTGGLASPPDSRNNSPTVLSGSNSTLAFTNLPTLHALQQSSSSSLVHQDLQISSSAADIQMNDLAHEEADDKMDGSLLMVASGAMDDEDDPMTGVAEQEMGIPAHEEADDQTDGSSLKKVVSGSLEEEDVQTAEVEKKNPEDVSMADEERNSDGEEDADVESTKAASVSAEDSDVDSTKPASVSSEDEDDNKSDGEVTKPAPDSSGDEYDPDDSGVKSENPVEGLRRSARNAAAKNNSSPLEKDKPSPSSAAPRKRKRTLGTKKNPIILKASF
jgi:hypothetical protein